MAVKYVIFDMGGVLMDFDTQGLAAAFADAPEDAALLHREVFGHIDWLTMDRGGTEAAALERMKSRLPQRLHRPADQLMAHWDEYLTPIPAVNELAGELDGMGIPIYLLSNTSSRFYQFRERIPVWPLLRGAVISCEERLLKPDTELYRRLFSRFGLPPGDCFFIDDNSANIEAALWCGMQGFLYRGGADELRRALRRAGIPVANRGAAGRTAGGSE